MSDIIRSSVLVVVAVVALSLGSPAVAADAERGGVLAYTCLGCHGIPGYRNAYPSFRVPMLGGQHEEYLVIALQGYRAGMRSHPTMNAQSASLSDEDMRDLAAYFASKGPPQQGEPVTAGRAAAGKEKIAVCSACHGQTGISPAPNWPNLAGQHQDYLVHAITSYREGGRKDPVMMSQAVNLSDQDISDIAAYYAQQSGLFTAVFGK
jgi:cytochrome c553